MTKPLNRITVLSLAGFLTFTGLMHFVVPGNFDQLVPPWLPGSARFYVLITGLGELLIGLGLFKQSTRHYCAWAAVIIFLVVFPGNIYMAYDWRDREFSQQLIAYLRLPFQIPLILWALNIARKTSRE